jgi:hypothetical protein
MTELVRLSVGPFGIAVLNSDEAKRRRRRSTKSIWVGVFDSAPTVWPSPNEKPNRYATAICIMVRSDCLLLDTLSAKAAACPGAKGRNGPQTLSGCRQVFAERLFLFLLGCLLCLLSLLRFLGHVALRGPQKLTQCKSTIDVHASRIHHNCKIDTARFENGKRPERSPRVMLTNRALLAQDDKKFFHVVRRS